MKEFRDLIVKTKEEANAFIKNSKDYEILKKYNN